ncbi:MAG: hypothetical protein OEY85_06875, partial [Rhodospirillales bacterium]|nr:hypothetical protein [Rhodospirillales bacterium]
MNRVLWISVIGASIIVIAMILSLLSTGEESTIRSAPEQAAPGKTAAPAAVPPPTANPEKFLPAFDVARVTPNGEVVIAGRAVPGSKVTILDGGNSIGEVTANERGEWVFIPDTPLPPGDHHLGLEMQSGDGPPRRSDNYVLIVVPERDKDIAGRPATQDSQSLVLKVPREGKGGSAVLQSPTRGGQKLADGALSVDAVDYDEKGEIHIGGHAPPGGIVQLYLDNEYIGRSRTGEDGTWSMVPSTKVEPGIYT